MATSQRLRLRDVRSVFRLLGECCELGADPIAWRHHLAEQLPALFGGQGGHVLEVQVIAAPFQKPFWLRPLMIADYGWATPSDRKPYEEHIAGGRPEEGPHITPDLLERPRKIVTWSGNLGRSGWLESEFFNRYVKSCHLDDGLFAHEMIVPGRFRWLLANRALGDRPFSQRDRRLMALLNRELARLARTRLAGMDETSVADLPPRLRDVLICLMEGDSEKQVARRLALSPHTVHDYVKSLHLRFGVRSRGELLARCRAYWPVLYMLAADDASNDAVNGNNGNTPLFRGIADRRNER